jgi:hypothetical protein
MKKSAWLTYIFTCLVVTSMIFIATSCANIVPPTGGPRDSLPPYLIATKPQDSALGIKPKEIMLAFNEYVNTSDIFNNFVMNPAIKNTPQIDYKLNVVRIKITDTLADNTTYSLQFGNAIRDVNENNVAKNLTYVFSTGQQIDTGSFFGRVQLAETGLTDSTLIVGLYPIDKDSAVFKSNPPFIAKLNGQGRFAFHFLPNNKYNAYVLPNEYSKKYDDSTKLFAFLDAPVQIGAKLDSQSFFVFQAFKKIEKRRSASNKNKLAPVFKIQKHLDQGQQDQMQPLHLGYDFPIVWNTPKPFILTDSNHKILENVTISKDSLDDKLFYVAHPWEHSNKYELIIPKGSITDTNHIANTQQDTVRFTVKPESDYGSVIFRCNGLSQFTHPVLLITSDNKVKFSYPIQNSVLRVGKIIPGEYQIKILEDANQNGKWDNGLFGTIHRQPEKVWDMKIKVNIKGDWENEFNLNLNK